MYFSIYIKIFLYVYDICLCFMFTKLNLDFST